MSHPTLLDIGVKAYTHQAEVDEVRQRLNITHHYFDCWIYGFLENKNFNIEETVAKLKRRETFEKEQIAEHTFTDWMMDNMRKGIMQVIGHDKEGRVAFYVVTARDRPTSAHREESKNTFDMMISYGTRLRADNKRCQMVMLINQDKASMWSNIDMTFQADIALRIAKFYPGCVDRIYVCNMNRTLTALAKPVFSRLPSIVSDRIVIISEGDKKSGKLLEYFDKDVLPVALGGTNDCDHEENYSQFAVNIREHFEQMKSALHRGLSVKEWELTCLFPQGLPDETNMVSSQRGSLVRPPPESWNHRFNDRLESEWSKSMREDSLFNDLVDVVTCDTLNADCFVDPHDGGSSASGGKNNVAERISMRRSFATARKDFMEDYVEQFVLLELFFRNSISEAAEREWLSIFQREVFSRQMLSASEEDLGKNTILLRRLPATMQPIAKCFLWISLTAMSFYFLIASIFGALYLSYFMVILFFSMMEPYKVFPFGCAFMVIGCQSVLFTSRGIELARRTYEGKVVDPVKSFGPKGVLAQALIFFAAVTAFFIVFCVTAARYDAITGFQYSMAIGWIVALCVIVLYHFLYAFGVTGYHRSEQRDKMAVATLYFFLDLDMDTDNEVVKRRNGMEVTLSTLLALVAFGFGLCYILDDRVLFLLVSVITTVLACLLTVLFVNAEHASSRGGLLVSAALYTGVTWMTIVFTSSTHGWNGDWGCSAGILLALALITDIIVLLNMFLTTNNKKAHRWMFRASWLWIIVQFMSFLVLVFIIDYRLGIIVIALGVHLMLYGLRVTVSCTNHGLMIATISFIALLIFCIVGGAITAGDVYNTPASQWLLTLYTKKQRDPSPLSTRSQEPSSFLPLCLTRFLPGLDVVGMALFAKLANAGSLGVTVTDLEQWFPDFTYVSNHTFSSSSFLQAKIFSMMSDEHKTTIIALGSSGHRYPVIESMTMWIDILALSCVAAFTPPTWFAQLVAKVSATEKLSRLLWRSSIAAVRADLSEFIAENSGPTHDVYLVGYGLAGAVAAHLATSLPQNIYGVVFESPLNAVSWHDGGRWITDARLGRVLSIVSSSSVFSLRWMWGNFAEMIPCDGPTGECYTIESIVQLLNQICDYHTAPSV